LWHLWSASAFGGDELLPTRQAEALGIAGSSWRQAAKETTGGRVAPPASLKYQ
jgi:hypothetical protein